MVEATRAGAAGALSQLTHYRWALPVLAHVARHGGCKLVTLSRRLGVSPSGLRPALDRLAELGLVVRNPGYGHPMRPEYVLGPVGERTDGLPAAIIGWTERERVSVEVLKKWQLPVLVALGPDTTRFGEVRGRLPGASPRAITLALKSHEALGLVARDVDSGYPPVPRYSPTALAHRGREPAYLLGELLAAG